MKIFFLLTLCSFVLSGCSVFSGKPVLNAAAVNVSDKDLKQYWVSHNDTQSINPNSVQHYILTQEDVYAVVSYLIDSNGDVHEIAVLDTNQEHRFDNLIEKALDKRKFTPAESNPERVPVYVKSRLEFSKN